MKKFLFPFLLSLLLACGGGQPQDKLDGRVVGIADGDTFTLLTPENKQVKVRLYGIDCPERSQDFGTVARQRLSDLIFSQPVRLDQQNTDRYGRTVAIVYDKNGLCVNEQLLRDGLAWHYKQYDKKHPAWDDLEAEARLQRKGLWAMNNPTPPWNYRKAKRKKAEKAKEEMEE